MIQIKDIVECSSDTTFRSDVQLGWYPESQENTQLVKSYIFSKQSAGDKKSPIDILKLLRDAYVVAPPDNRYLVIATFGHGKSHLALAAANYFGKEPSSQEVQYLLDNIENAYGGANPEAKAFKDFKEQRNRHLVICLNGTKFTDLQQHFLSELKRSLGYALGKSDFSLPFWFAEAEEFLAALTKDEVKQINRHLQDKELDHQTLLERIKSHDQSAYNLTRDAVKHLRGIRPDWEGHVSLANLLDWLTKTYCGVDRPFSGVLILFDEFSAFVRSYSKRTTPGSPLQDLLEGVANNRQKVVFTAFAQYDPVGWVQEMSESQSKEVLLTELDRIPKSCRFSLFNTMETILDSFLVLRSEVLDRALTEGNAWAAFSDVSTRAHSLFQRRYEQDLGWNSEKFDTVVTKGCFPLHPMTTSLLCAIEFQEVGNTRTVLGFVMEQISHNATALAVNDSAPRWVVPAALAEFFRNGELADEEWKQYKQALSTGGGDLIEAHYAVLRALLLWTTAKLPTRHVKQLQALSDFSGLSLEATQTALKELADRHVISYEDTTSKYTFFPVGGGNLKVIEAIRRRKQGRAITWQELTALNKKYSGEWELLAIPNQIPWGNANDWASGQYLLLKEFCRPERIKEVLSSADNKSAIFWLCAKTDADVTWLRDNAQKVIDAIVGSPPTPVIFVKPTKPSPILYEKLQEQAILEEFTPTEDQDFGPVVMYNIRSQTKKSIRDEIASLRQAWKEYSAPTPMQVALNARPPITTIPALTVELTKLAYQSAPPYFFDQYKESAPKLRKAVLAVARLLLEDRVATNEFGNDPIAPQIIEKFLLSGHPTSWCVLNSSKRLQKPSSTSTAKAWTFLETKIAPGETGFFITKAVAELQRPPFGYDSNTLTLLVSAWIGFYQFDIEVSVAGQLQSVDIFVERLKTSTTPEDFIAFLTQSKISIKRRDRSKEDQAILQILEKVKKLGQNPYSAPDAGNDLAQLNNYVNDQGNAHRPNTKAAKAAAQDLRAALEASKRYDNEAMALQTRSSAATSIEDLLSTCQQAASLPPFPTVTPSGPRPEEIQKVSQAKLASTVILHCERFEKLAKLEEYTRNQDELRRLRPALAGYPSLLERIEKAALSLEEEKNLIDKKRLDESTVAPIRHLTPVPSLAATRQAISLVSEAKLHLPENIALKEEKLRLFKSHLSSLLEYIVELPNRLDQLASAKALQNFAQEATARQSAYEGTEEGAKLTAALNRASALATVFSQVESTLKQPIAKPDVAASQASQVLALKESNTAILSPAQAKTIENASTAIQRGIDRKRNEALQWLSNLEAKAKTPSEWDSILKDLEHPSDFLPNSRQERLTALRTQIATQIKERNELEGQRKSDAAKLSLIDAQATSGTLEELESRLALIEGIDLSLEESRQRKISKLAALQAAITRAKEARALEDAQKKDHENLNFLTALSANSALEDLRTTLRQLDSLSLLLADSRTIQSAKSQELRRTIAEREAFAAAARGKLDDASSIEQVKTIAKQLTESRLLFTGSPELIEIDKCTARAEKLESFFSQLSAIQLTRIKTPADEQTALSLVSALRAGFDGSLSNCHANLLAEVGRGVAATVEKLARVAEEWLADKARARKQEELPQLLTELSNPPPFLRPERSPELQALRTAVQASLDGDAAHQVVSNFQKISDPQKRRETLRQLEKLL